MDDKRSDTENCVNLNNVINTYTRTTGGGGGVINDSNATFITDGVNIGDLACRPGTTSVASRVIAVPSETQIVCNVSFLGVGTSFSILSQSDEPAVLYVGTVDTTASPTLKVTTMGGDDVTFHNPVQGSFLPVQTKRIFVSGTTGVSNVLALF